MAATKKLDRRYIEHVAREIDRVVRERFEGNQTRAAKALGISQSHLSHLIAAEGRGPGLNVLLRLRYFTERSIDSLLGLPPLPTEELLERLRMSLETDIARKSASAAKATEAARVRIAEAAAIEQEKAPPKPARAKKSAG